MNDAVSRSSVRHATAFSDFLTGGGEMGALMRAHDWSATPLGDPEAWPPSLRSALSTYRGKGSTCS